MDNRFPGGRATLCRASHASDVLKRFKRSSYFDERPIGGGRKLPGSGELAQAPLIPDPACPVCDAHRWETIGTRSYQLADLPRLSDYTARRYRVLFEIWFPGQSEIRFEWRLCGRCGFVLYAPRPSSEDLERKYRYLCSLGPDAGTLDPDDPIEEARAKELYRQAAKYSWRRAKRVLDFGGGDGRLMARFLDRGSQCFLVDYTSRTMPGVIRLGETLRDLGAGARFDLIVCSHVLEHLADPLETVGALRQRLAAGGVLYVEVPMEIWRRPPIREEPVTHVNFFTLDSLRVLLCRVGLRVRACRLGSCPYGGGRRETVVRAWADGGRAGFADAIPAGCARRTRELLAPGLTARLRMALARTDRLLSRLRNLFGA